MLIPHVATPAQRLVGEGSQNYFGLATRAKPLARRTLPLG